MNASYALLEPPPAPLIVISCSPTMPVTHQLTPIMTDMSPPPVPPQHMQMQMDPMEHLWHSNFDQLFSTFWPSRWSLVPKPLVNCSVANWNLHSDAAKVRFLCQVCGHGWTSMKGRVMFWYSLDPRTLCGTVAFALFGQKCQECSREGFDNFTASMWYQEEVVKVIFNVYNSVGQSYYGFQQPPYVKMRRPGKPRSQHASELCQACQMGLCSAMGNKKEVSVSANHSYPSSHPVSACAIVQANSTPAAMIESSVA